MSTVNRDAARRPGHQPMAMCSNCSHDLEVRRQRPGHTLTIDARVYCTNTGCPYNRRPHGTGPTLNTGVAGPKRSK